MWKDARNRWINPCFGSAIGKDTVSKEERLHTFVRLLRYADANGFIGTGSNRQEVLRPLFR